MGCLVRHNNAILQPQHALIPQNVVTMLVIMAVVTTAVTGPLLQILLPRAGYRIPVGIEP
jgi:hypothetical protein